MTKKVDFKPMLCASFKGLETFQPPYYVSYKLDGVRCLMIDGVALSRKLIPFPNKLLQLKAKELYSAGYNYLDGELIIGDILDKLVFRGECLIKKSVFKVSYLKIAFYKSDLLPI